MSNIDSMSIQSENENEIQLLYNINYFSTSNINTCYTIKQFPCLSWFNAYLKDESNIICKDTEIISINDTRYSDKYIKNEYRLRRNKSMINEYIRYIYFYLPSKYKVDCASSDDDIYGNKKKKRKIDLSSSSNINKKSLTYNNMVSKKAYDFMISDHINFVLGCIDIIPREYKVALTAKGKLYI